MEFCRTDEKLDMDFAGMPRLRHRMTDEDEERQQLIRRLFYLITVAAEDAAAIAVKGRAAQSDHSRREALTKGLRELGEWVEILAMGEWLLRELQRIAA